MIFHLRVLARRFPVALAATLTTMLAACGGSSSGSDAPQAGVALAPVTPPPATGTVPVQPAQGASRAGQVYTMVITSPGTNDQVGITVFEPKTLVGGQRYPLILQAHGYGGRREVAGSTVIQPFLDAGYGAISISQRGSDESTGTIRTMDPDFEGKNLLAVLDWAESLPWAQFGTGVDGSTNNLVVGAIGGSYGGMYQYLINNIDPRHRLDAITPEFAPNDLTYSLFPNDVLKGTWGAILTGAGSTAGSNARRANTDPFIVNFFEDAVRTNKASDAGREFFYYHSNAYFCNGRDVVNNGTTGGAPGTPGTVIKAERRAVPAGKTNALLFQGMRDTLFPFNDGFNNYQCLKATGGDVRLLTYQTGHNALHLIPDPGNDLYENAANGQTGNESDSRCGTVDVTAARLAFFEQYLKGVAGAADRVIPNKPCLSITKGDAVLVDQVTTGRAGRETPVATTSVLAGGPVNAATAIPLNVPRVADQVLAGIPFVELTVAKAAAGAPGEPILLLGLGRTRRGATGVYDLIDNQLTPIRGTGTFAVDLVGVAERLGAADDLALLVYGQQDQYVNTGTVNAATPAVVPVSIGGKVWLPLLGALPNAPK